MRKGEEWARATDGRVTARVEGDDADLAAAVRAAPGGLFDFRPRVATDVARSVGLRPGAVPSGRLEVAMDALAVDGSLALVSVVVGRPPERLGRLDRRRRLSVEIDGRRHDALATTVVVATGQWRDGLDLVPRGHPGDGRGEVQVYALAGAQRAEMRRRLATGTHVPHPAISEHTGRRVEVRPGSGRWSLVLDAGPSQAVTGPIRVEVVPAAYRILL